MKPVKKYLIEFVVIVLGVSVSFLAEQWRQKINDHAAAKVLAQEARNEGALLLSYEALSPGKNFPVIIKRAIDQKKINPDTLLSILSFLENDLPLQKFIPSIFKSASSNILPPNQTHLLQSIVGNSDRLIQLNQTSRKLIKTELYSLMDKYGLLNDYLTVKYDRMMESKSNGVNTLWKPLVLPKNPSGNYDQFMKDEAVLRLLRMVNMQMVEESILVMEVKLFITQFLETPS